MQYRAPDVPPMFISRSSTNELSVEDNVDKSTFGEEMKWRTCLAPSRKVYPQSPSPTMVSYSVIMGSDLMIWLQPAVMSFRT